VELEEPLLAALAELLQVLAFALCIGIIAIQKSVKRAITMPLSITMFCMLLLNNPSIYGYCEIILNIVTETPIEPRLAIEIGHWRKTVLNCNLFYCTNHPNEKYHIAELAMQVPPIQKVINNEGKPSRELAYSVYIIGICSHADAMRQRKVLKVVTVDEKLFSERNDSRNMETSRA
jgi:hypothetical protein